MKTKKNLITALKKLVTSFGGEAKSNNTVDLVDEFADVAAQGGGFASPLILEFATENPLTVNTPLSEIKAAIEAGRQVWFKMNAAHIALVQYDQFENVLTYLCFCSTTIELDGSVGSHTSVEYYDDEWHLTEI